MKAIERGQNFKAIRTSVLNDLKAFWTSTDGGAPAFYQYNKLVDLFLKDLPRWDEWNADVKNWLFENLNVPLDKFSLDLLRRSEPALNIPKNASMNFVKESNYDSLQQHIRKICKELPPIVFDLYAWNESHRPMGSFELIRLVKKDTPKYARV